MYITVNKSRGGKKIYQSVLLRESYREGGKVKNRTIANLSHCKPNEIEAIRLALMHKDDLAALTQTTPQVELREGLSIGALWTVFETARRLGIQKTLGTGRQGKLALWQVLARVLDQGSRLSAVRLAGFHAAAEVLGLERGFDENDLYRNLGWLAHHQEKIENRLFTLRNGEAKPGLFLYDVTSSYLEGDHNELADWGYNRDKKRGKKQIVIGLLCDPEGKPVSTEVFCGNTADLSTFSSQVRKAADRFGCERVTFVGDRGMIKSGQIADLAQAGFHYITAITKAQIRSLIKKGVLQLGLFDQHLCEIAHGDERYILRRNPIRAEEIAKSRSDKLTAPRKLADEQNAYLAAHPKAGDTRAWRLVIDKCDRLGLSEFVTVKALNRLIILEVDEDYLRELAELDGCYALRTDLPAQAADAKTVHDRYKDLALVEQGFRTMKTDHLQVRPVFVRTEAHTRGHVLVVMLAYMIVRELRRCWAGVNLTVEEALKRLTSLCTMTLVYATDGMELHKIPAPREESAKLLEAAEIRLPEALPGRRLDVVTKQKLPPQRKTS